jgi:hypothetical protein
MSRFIALLIYIYSRLLLLYPRYFRNVFAEEMQVVFTDSVNEAVSRGNLPVALSACENWAACHSISCGSSGTNLGERGWT